MDFYSNVAFTPNLLLTFWLTLQPTPNAQAEPAARSPRQVMTAQKDATPLVKVNLNSATRAQLLQLPGVNAAVAEQIVRNRPYDTIDDLHTAGLLPAAVERLRPLAEVVPRSKMPVDLLGSPSSQKIDINSASLEKLQNLPGVGPALGARLMAGRPFRTMDDVARIGVPLNVVERIRPLVVLGP